MRRAKQAIRVIVHTEYLGALIGCVRAHTLKHPKPVMQRVRQHMHLGLAPLDQFTIYPDDTVSVCQGTRHPVSLP